MGEASRLVEEEILDDDEVHGLQCTLHMLGVGIGLGDVLTLHEERLELTHHGGIEHVGDAHAGIAAQLRTPQHLELLADCVIGDVSVARKLVRERAHVARALDVVLPAQRVDAHAFATDIARRHREIGHGHDHRRSLAVLGDAQAVVDSGVGSGGEEPSSRADLLGGDTGECLDGLGGILRLADEILPGSEGHRIAPVGDKLPINESLGRDHVPHGVDDRDIGAGLQLQVIVGLDVG